MAAAGNWKSKLAVRPINAHLLVLRIQTRARK
jgi:hypothetical protein